MARRWLILVALVAMLATRPPGAAAIRLRMFSPPVVLRGVFRRIRTGGRFLYPPAILRGVFRRFRRRSTARAIRDGSSGAAAAAPAIPSPTSPAPSPYPPSSSPGSSAAAPSAASAVKESLRGGLQQEQTTKETPPAKGADGGEAGKLATLQAQGFKDEKLCHEALEAANGDVRAAAERLKQDEEKLATMKAKGYDNVGVCREALLASDGNATKAIEKLKDDELALGEQLEEAVQTLVGHGWAEDAVRLELLERMEKRRSRGEKSSDAFADDAKRLLSAKNGTAVAAAAPASASPSNGASDSAPTAAAAAAAPASGNASTAAAGYTPPPVNMSEVYFNITKMGEVQKSLLDSAVPVVLDVHATWCEPCKALAPVLEKVTGGAGGQLKVAKLDSEEVPVLAELLKVKALPSVFVFKRGKIVDSFVGIPSQEQLQQFFMRVVMDDIPRPKPQREVRMSLLFWNEAIGIDACELLE